MNTERPYPPEHLLDPCVETALFVPANDVVAWMQATFIEEDAPLSNQDHWHLAAADIAVLWTNATNRRHMRDVVGTAEIPLPQGGGWNKARSEFHLHQLFGRMPDFLITLYAPYAAQASDAAFCALVEHELYHCAQRTDVFGAPKFDKNGRAVWGIRGHDVEEFVGVVRRYGMVSPEIAALVAAANRKPTIDAADIASCCGTCLRMVG